jgi:hypothetical protein
MRNEATLLGNLYLGIACCEFHLLPLIFVKCVYFPTDSYVFFLYYTQLDLYYSSVESQEGFGSFLL